MDISSQVQQVSEQPASCWSQLISRTSNYANPAKDMFLISQAPTIEPVTSDNCDKSRKLRQAGFGFGTGRATGVQAERWV